MTERLKRKRGRPPKTISSGDGTEIAYRDMGLDRKRISDAIAIASIPEDVFEKRLADAKGASIGIGKARRLLSTQGLVRLACELGTTNRKAPMRDTTPLEVARKAVAKLSRNERVVLAREVIAELEREADKL